MSPIDRFMATGLVSLAIFLSGLAAPVDAQSSGTLVTRATAPVPRDHYLLTLTLTRHSRDEAFAPGSIGHEWKNAEGDGHGLIQVEYGPLKVEMRLMPIRGGPPENQSWSLWRARSAEVELATYLLSRDAAWKSLAEDKAAAGRRQRGEFFNKEYGALKAAMPELEERMERIDAYAEDADRLLRLIHGVTTYRWTDDTEQPIYLPRGEAPIPAAGPICAQLAGASWQRTYQVTGTGQGTAETGLRLDGWATEDLVAAREGINAQHFRNGFELDVWRFESADYERAAALLADPQALRRALCEDSAELRRTAEGTSLLQVRLMNWRPRFCEPLFAGLRQVVEIAWRMASSELPNDLFDGDGELRSEVALRLPELAPGPWFRLRLPERLLRNDGALRQQVASGTSHGTDPRDGSWNISVQDRASFRWLTQPGQGRQPPSGVSGARIYPLLPDRGGAVRQARLFLHGQGVGDRFSGSWIGRWRHERAFPDSRYTLDDQLTVRWGLLLGGEPGVRPPERIDFRIVELTDGAYVPIEGPLRHGQPFFLEGQLEEEPQREVYAVTLRAEGEEQKVFLQPTEGDRRLLRSALLYTMWALEGGDDATP
ncbi:MAG: hypothetical protein AAF657_13120 [Acidobacteriota bacterium]